MRFDVVGGEREVALERSNSPRVTAFGARLGPMHQIAFGHDADKLAFRIDSQALR